MSTWLIRPNPTELGFFDTPGYALNVFVSGATAYVADGISGLRIINIADPTNPTQLGFFDTGGYEENVFVSDDIAYVASGRSGLYILRHITTPPTPTPDTPTPTTIPTDTPSHTPTSTLTPTPTNTPVTINTPVTRQSCSTGRDTDILACANYLPMVARSDPPTPTATPLATATSVSAWRQIAGSELNSVALAVQGNTLFVGTYGRNGSERGLYAGNLSTCPAGVALSKVSDIKRPGGESVFGISFLNDSGIVASYDSGVYYTINGGQQWALMSSPSSSQNPRTVAIVGNNFFAGTERNGIYLSQDGGVNWQQRYNQPAEINTIAIGTVDPSLVWIGADNVKGQGGVWRLNSSNVDQLGSKNEGLSGAALNVWDFAFDNNNIYIATDGGVYQATVGSAWALSGSPPAGVRFRSLALIGTTLYAGAAENGVWRLSDGVWKPVISDGWNERHTVLDLLYQANECGGLLAATNNGVWLYPAP